MHPLQDLCIGQILWTMKYKIDEIEGVGEAYAEKLKAEGISTVDELLERGRKPAGRKELAEKTGISSKLILKWVNHADLFRVDGVGPQFAELLEASGVDTVKEMRHRKAENLVAAMERVNAEKKLTRRVPSVAEMTRMIECAAALEPMVEY